MIEPIVSTIVITYNRAPFLADAIESLSTQTLSEQEIIVVDDASKAGRVSSVAAEFPHVRSLRLPRRRGFCAAANAGIRAARQGFTPFGRDAVAPVIYPEFKLIGVAWREAAPGK